MKIHWLFKYYLAVFSIIFLIVYYIESSKPYLNWALYDENKKLSVNEAVKKADCKVLKAEYKEELNLNYKKSVLGFNVRKDKNMIKGQNLLGYIKFHLKNLNC